MSAGEQAPCEGVISAVWNPIENQTAVTSNSGNTDVLELGTPFWEVEINVDCPNHANFDTWVSFLHRRRMFDLTFTMWNHLRPLPSDRTITSDTGLTLGSISEANSTLTFSGFGASKTAGG